MQVVSKKTFRAPPLGDLDEFCVRNLELNANLILHAFDKNSMLTGRNIEAEQYMNCVWKNSGYLNDDGSFNNNRIKMWVTNTYVKNLKAPYVNSFDMVNVEKNVDFFMTFCNFRANIMHNNPVEMYNCLVQHMLIFINLE